MRTRLGQAVWRIYCALDDLRQRGRQAILGSERGATTVEYALLIAVIVTMVIAAATYMFEPLQEFFKSVVEKIQKMADETTAKPKF